MRRWLLERPAPFWLGVSCALIALIAFVSVRSNDNRTILSPRSANGEGGLALSLWLGRIGYHVEDVTSSPDLIHRSARRSTLFLLPGGDADSNLTSALLHWVQFEGNRLVVVTNGINGSSLFHALGLTTIATSDEPLRITQPLLLSPPVSNADGNTSVAFANLPVGGEAAAIPDGPVLARRSLGVGEVWVLTVPDVLDNTHLARAQNSALAVNLAGPRDGTVLLDEYSPALPSSMSNWLTSTVWGALAFFLLSVMLLYRWLAGCRLGPAIVPLSEGHRAATEYVLSIARLLQRGNKRDEILRSYQNRLRRALIERFGTADPEHVAGVSRVRMGEVLAPATRLDDRELIRRVADIVQCEDDLRSRRV